MYTLIFVTSLLICIVFFLRWVEEGKFMIVDDGVPIIIMGSIVAALVTLFLSAVIKPQPIPYTTEFNLVSAKDDVGSGGGGEGSFLGHSWAINRQGKFFFYRQRDGFFELRGSSASKTRVVYTKKQPKVIYHEILYKKRKWLFNLNNLHFGFLDFVELQVPTDSIIIDYKFDTK